MTDTTSVLTLASGASQNLGYEGSDESQSNAVPAWLPAGESLIAKHLMSPDSLLTGASVPGGDTDRQRRQDKAMENYRYLLKQEARRWGTTTPDGYSSDHTVLEWSRLPLTRLATSGSGSASVWGINEPDSDYNTCSCCHACCQLSPGDSEVSSIFRAAAHTGEDGVRGGGEEGCCDSCCGVGDDGRGVGGGVGGSGGEEDVVYGIPDRSQDHHHQQQYQHHQHHHHHHQQHQQQQQLHRQQLRKGQHAKRASSSDDSDGVCPGCQHHQLQHPVSEGKRYHSQPNVFTISSHHKEPDGIGDQRGEKGEEEEEEGVGGYYGPKQSVSDSEGLSRKHGGVVGGVGGGGGVSKKSKHSDKKKHRDHSGSKPARERHHHHQHHNTNHHHHHQHHHHHHRDDHDVGQSANDRPREAASPPERDAVPSKKEAPALSSPRVHNKPAAISPRAVVVAAVDRKDSATPVPSKLQVKAIAEKSDEENMMELKPGILPSSSSSSSTSTEPIYENVSARSQKQQQQQQQNQTPQTTSNSTKDGSRAKSKDLMDKTDLEERKDLKKSSSSHRNEEDEPQGMQNKDVDCKLKKLHKSEELQNKANRDKTVSSSSSSSGRRREGHSSAQTNSKKSSRASHDNRKSSGRGNDLWYMCSESEDSALPPETFSSSVDDGFTGTDLDESDGSIELII